MISDFRFIRKGPYRNLNSRKPNSK